MLGVGETGYAVVVGIIAGSFDGAAPVVSRVIMLLEYIGKEVM